MIFVQSPSEAVASQLPMFLTQGAALCPCLWRNTLSSRSSQHKKAMFTSCAKCHTRMLCHLPVSRFCTCPLTSVASLPISLLQCSIHEGLSCTPKRNNPQQASVKPVFTCMSVLSACVFVLRACPVLTEARTRHQILWNLSHREL